MKKCIATAIAAVALLAIFARAQEATGAASTSTNDALVLSGSDAVPDGVSIIALDEDFFKVLAVATAPYKESSPTAISTAQTVADTKAKGLLSRFLNEKTELEDFLEKEVSKVRVVSSDGTVSSVETVARRVLTRIRTTSKSLLRGAIVLQAETIPSPDGPGGSFRVVVGASSATLKGAETLESGIDRAAP